MRAVLCKAYGPPDSLVLADVAPPRPAANEVLIDVHAAGVNFPDVLIVAGKYQYKPAFPFSPGAEVAGRVLAVGDKVTLFKPGERVIGLCGHGGFAEQVTVPEHKVLAMPDGMDFAVGSAIALTYGTTAHAFLQRARLRPGEWLLVHGASGGVGLSAVEMGKTLGARVIGTGGDDGKLAIALEHGADHVINYNQGPFREQVKALTGGNGADVIYDAVGGEAFDQSLRCINWDGRLLVIGFASGRIPQAPANLMLLKSCSVVGVFWGAWSEREPAANRENFRLVFEWWRQGKLRPRVSQVFELADTAKAIQALVDRKVVGKAIVRVKA
ncbi:MAG: NADPH:quinone oxidoreductase family protein [Alphaproteobacteria bacterium]|nr:NADPH:quinone oxidoreductase family protein [Alphaproteobacteria bacterium]